jgi:diadenosine tetraphosphate (Ap4A) HIT family hydrolase
MPTIDQGDADACMACDLVAHPDKVAGGRVADLGTWVVEHCIGPLGVGTMVVKPFRHVVQLADLDPTEVADLGPALRDVADAVTKAATERGEAPSQVYTCLWSHAGRRPGHVHFVVQPVTRALTDRFDAHGPELQMRMFQANEAMDPAAMAAASDRVRFHLTASPTS